MSPNFQTFNDLHHSGDLLVLPNAWNAKSALLLQERQWPAIATSSAAVAHSLGYEDGEGMLFHEYLSIISRISAVVNIPLSVDMEMGYGGSDRAIFDNILKLIDLGVAGINIEDSVITRSGRALKAEKPMSDTIAFIRNSLEAQGLDLFVNVRCDTYLLNVGNKREETRRRLKAYESAGANGIFLPCISQSADITDAVSVIQLPLNVMAVPGLPDLDTLRRLGVKRVSMGDFLFSKVYEGIDVLSRAIRADQNFSVIFS